MSANTSQSVFTSPESASSTQATVSSPAPSSSSPNTPPTHSELNSYAKRTPVRRQHTMLSSGQPYRRTSSKELETFEDLLREAGFKDVRVYTPEIEREEQLHRIEAEQDRLKELLQSYGPVTGRVAHFLSTWVAPKFTNHMGRAVGKSDFPAATSGQEVAHADSRPLVKPEPPSPLENRSRPPQPLISLRSDKALRRSSYSSSDQTPIVETSQLLASPVSTTSTATTSTVRPTYQADRILPSQHHHSTRSDPTVSRQTSSGSSNTQGSISSRPSRSRTTTKRAVLPEKWLDSATLSRSGTRTNSSTSIATDNGSRVPRTYIRPSLVPPIAGSSQTRNMEKSPLGPNPRRSSRSVTRRKSTVSDKLLARSASYSAATGRNARAAAAVTSTTRARVVCRSSSVGPKPTSGAHSALTRSTSLTGRKDDKIKTPILTPSRESDLFFAEQVQTIPPVPQIPSPLRGRGKAKQEPRRLGVSPIRLSLEDDDDNDHIDDDSDIEEPHLSNIFAPVSRQRSIKSLRACLDRHSKAALALAAAKGSLRSRLGKDHRAGPGPAPAHTLTRNGVPMFRSVSQGTPDQLAGFDEDDSSVRHSHGRRRSLRIGLSGRWNKSHNQISQNSSGRWQSPVRGWEEDES